MTTEQTQPFECWWAGRFGQVLELTGDPDADASCRIAKITAVEAWAAALANVRDALPAPPKGSPLEGLFADAMANPGAVGAYVAASIESLATANSHYRWLVDRFAGYDFNWMPSQVGKDDGKHVAVFEVGPVFPCSRDIDSAIGATIGGTEGAR